MNLMERISNDMKESLKSQDKFRLSVLRMLKSSLQLEGIRLKKELEEKEVIGVIKKNVKQRKDSIEEYQKYEKKEEIEKLEKEIEILKAYLPKELTEEEINQKIEEIFEKIKPQSMKEMGKIMGALTEEIGSVADMSLVSKKVKERLNE